MNKHSSCCKATSQLAREDCGNSRVIGSGKWIVPTALLALMPKCPMCVAAYIALASGFTISLSAAAWIRSGLLAACIGTLAYVLLRTAVRAFGRKL